MTASSQRRLHVFLLGLLFCLTQAVRAVAAEQESSTPPPAAATEPEPASAPSDPPPPEGLVGLLPEHTPDLLDGLDVLRPLTAPEVQEPKPWQEQVRSILDDLDRLYAGVSPGAAEPLSAAAQKDLLERLQSEEKGLGTSMSEAPDELADALRLLRDRLRRRLTVLAAGFEAIQSLEPPGEEQVHSNRAALAEAIGELDQLFRGWSTGDGWRRYVHFSELQELSTAEPADASPEEVARHVARFDPQGLDEKYRRAVERPEFMRVGQALERYRLDLVRLDPQVRETLRARLRELWVQLETYERAPDPAFAPRLRQMTRELAGTGAAGQRVADAVTTSYVGRNVWIAISRVLMQRFLPKSWTHRGALREVEGGTYVSGEHVTRASPRLRFYESTPGALSLGVTGTVDTSLVASQERADVAASIRSGFDARRRIEVTHDGLRAGTTDIDVRADSRVAGANVRGVLLFQGAARRRAAEIGQRELARSRPETEARVAREVLAQFNPKVDEFVSTFNEKFEELRQKWNDEGNEKVDIATKSTEHWLLMDLTFAGNEQFGAQSIRLPTPPGTIGGVQAHQSAANNVLDSAELAGGTFTRDELLDMLREAVSPVIPEPKQTAEESAEETPLTPLSVTFDDHDPVRVAIDAGAGKLTVRATRLEGPSFAIGPRVIHVRYRPVLDAENLRLVREGEIAIELLDKASENADDTQETELHAALEETFAPEIAVVSSVVSVPAWEEGKEVELRLLEIAAENGWVALAIGL